MAEAEGDDGGTGMGGDICGAELPAVGALAAGADFEVEEGGGVQVSFLRVGREQTLLVYSNKNGYKIGQKVTFYRGKLRGVRG